MLHLALYVDDLLFMAEKDEDLVEIKKCLCETFEMKDLGIAKRFLEMDIENRSNGEIKIHPGKSFAVCLKNTACRNATQSLHPSIIRSSSQHLRTRMHQSIGRNVAALSAN